MEELTIQDQYKLKELELNALLEVTQAINNNFPENDLYRIYNFTLRANLDIKKLALYVLDEHWVCKANFGTDTDFIKEELEGWTLEVSTITDLSQEGLEGKFAEFTKIVPVAHKNEVLAYVFIGEGEEYLPMDGLRFLQTFSNIIIVAIENKKLARRQLLQEALKKEMEIARNVQSFLFPKTLPQNDDFEVIANYIPHHTVGGDYYDFIDLNEREVLMCIADVSGKGVPAALLMSNFQASLRILSRQTQDLLKIVEELNLQVLKNGNQENFITFFLALYNKEDKRMHYINAGHNPPYLIEQNKPLERLSTGTTVLGMLDPLPFLEFGERLMEQSFLLFSYTDGLTETFNDYGEEFGEERLEKYLLNTSGQSTHKLHVNLLKMLDEFRGHQSYRDDVTLLSCRVAH